MSGPRFSRLQKATALVPLALLSAAWTASIAGVGAPVAATAQDEKPATLPDGTSVPTAAIEAPASVSSEGVAGGFGGAEATQIVNTASTSGIPSAALAAYQRAETVINAADKTCNLSWQLIAAIGRVESNHGRANGNTLDQNGLATPGIYGIALDGTRNTAAIADTDAGQFDNDTEWDRAIGPMQFIPSTWSVVGVDADGDGERNPQDIDDAALGTAVYLCSGSENLGAREGQESAVFRYNHSSAYVDLVLRIMDAYLEGDFTSVPNSTVAAGYIVPESFDPGRPAGSKQKNGTRSDKPATGTTTEKPAPSPSPTTAPKPQTPPPTTDPGTGGPKPPPPTQGPGDPVKDIVKQVTQPSAIASPVDEILTKPQATTQCLAEFGVTAVTQLRLTDLAAFDACVKDLTT